jgi:two-component system, response regulator PdtaR
MENRPKVLITEDKSITALDLKNTIEHLGFSVISIVKSGEEALIKIEEDKPDLVFMDIMLKGYYTGIETAEIIRRKYKIPLIFITALNDDETYLRASMTNPLAIITKPYSEALLMKAVKKLASKKITA